MKMLRFLAGATLLAISAAACGGGDDEGGGPGISPPAEPEATTRPTSRPARTPAKPSPVTGSLEPADEADDEPAPVPTEAPPPASQPDPTPATAPANIDTQLVGTWRIYSESFYYDAGGGGVMDSSQVVGTDLVLYGDGSWEFGSSYGWWSVATIDGTEWARWLVDPYGPTRKIVLDGWNGSAGDGPLDEESGYVDFVWVIYHVDSPDPGTVYIKFGH